MMKRASKTLPAGVLFLAFALGMTCAASAASGNLIKPCWQISQATDLSDCSHVAFICPFAAAPFSQGLPDSFRSTIHPNGAGDIRQFGVAVAALIDLPLGMTRGRQDAHWIGRVSSVSIGLFNSVLNI